MFSSKADSACNPPMTQKQGILEYELFIAAMVPGLAVEIVTATSPRFHNCDGRVYVVFDMYCHVIS